MDYKITVTKFEKGQVPIDVEYVVTAPEAAEAMGLFVAENGSSLVGDWYVELIAAQPTGPAPTRRQRNYERDPFEDTSEGFLSNMAGDWANLRDSLAYQPEYCPAAIVHVICPNCGEKMARREGRYGKFYACGNCQTKFSADTKKARKAMRFVRFCGCAKKAGTTNTGVPMAYCPTHDNPPRYEFHAKWGADLLD